jgi:hypothetical protein
MAASNTSIQIKRSIANNTPGLLKSGELAYSYASNTLFIGTPGSDGYLEVGAWSNYSANISSIGIGSSAVYGSTTNIPTITVDTHGKIIDIVNTPISTTLTVDGDTGEDSINLLNDTLVLAGGEGITTTANNKTVTFDVDDTVVRSNTAGLNQTIDGHVTISGNLVVQGTATYIDSVNLVVEEPIIFLANNNVTGDAVDIGFAGQYNNGTANVWTGLIRHAGDADKHYHLFQEYTGNPEDGNYNITTADAQYASLQVNELITGNNAVIKDTSCGSISFGFSAGNQQACGAIAIGSSNVGNQQACGAIAIGSSAGYTYQGCNSIAIGFDAGQSQAWDAVAFGRSAGQTCQSYYSIAVGAYSGETCQGYKAISMGRYAGQSCQQYQAVAIGTEAGRYSQTDCAVAIGSFAGRTCQGYKAVAVGGEAGNDHQSQFAVAVGYNAGNTCQGSAAVALGHAAGEYCQKYDSVAIGVASGRNCQGYQSVAIGNRAAHCCQQNCSVAIGNEAGYNNQGSNAIAIGNGAGYGCCCSQGHNSIAIGTAAGYCRTQHNSIILNASGCSLNSYEAGFYVNPIRANNATGGQVSTYNTTTKELVYTDVQINNQGITLANGSSITDTAGSANVYIKFLQPTHNTGNIAFYDPVTGELAYSTLGELHPYEIANGSYAWAVSATDGHMYSDSGTEIADSATNTLIGQNLDLSNTNTNRVAVGNYAGSSGQGCCAIAIGRSAGQSSQYCGAVALGAYAGYTAQSCNAIAIGSSAGYTYQGCNSIAIGFDAGQNQAWDAVALGRSAGQTCQSYYSIAVGRSAGQTCQGYKAIAMGRYAGECNQQYQAVALGTEAGRYCQTDNAVALGSFAGRSCQGYNSVAIGYNAGHCTQLSSSVAVGSCAGNYRQGNCATALGSSAGRNCQHDYAVAVGIEAGHCIQQQGAVAIGNSAGYQTQGQYAVAIGAGAGYGCCCSQGQYAVAIGYKAGYCQAAEGSIILNASVNALNTANAGFYVSATRYVETHEDIEGVAYYNPVTKELRYTYVMDGGVF